MPREREVQHRRLKINGSNKAAYEVNVRGILGELQEVQDPHSGGVIVEKGSSRGTSQLKPER